MKFDTYIPCEILKPYVRSLAVSETAGERTYKVLPDTGLVIGFQYKGRLSLLDQDKEIQLSTSGITGLNDTYRTFKSSPDIGTILVFFRETGAASFFKEPIHELFKESISLDNFMLHSDLLILEDRLGSARTDRERISLVEQFLVSRMLRTNADHLVAAAVTLILKDKGRVKVADLVKTLYTSQSVLEKRFRRVVGAPPKKFASLVRLRHTLQRYPAADSLTALGYEGGYYDQAHFIKEFKNFTGETPAKYFSAE